MIARPLAFASARLYQRLAWLTVAGLLFALLAAALPPLRVAYQSSAPARDVTAPNAPAPVAPTTQPLPPGLAPILNATLAADSAADYAVAPLAAPADGLHADNPAQQFATTFNADGVRVAPATGAALTLRATAISTADGSTPLAAVSPVSTGPRVEYRRDGLTEWYVNGPRGLEQGFTLAAPPAGGAQFTLSLATTGDMPTQSDNGLVIGDLRYRDLRAYAFSLPKRIFPMRT